MLPLDLFKGKLALEMLSDWFNNKSFGISVSTTVEWFSAGLFSIQIIFTRPLLARERGGSDLWSGAIEALQYIYNLILEVFLCFSSLHGRSLCWRGWRRWSTQGAWRCFQTFYPEKPTNGGSHLQSFLKDGQNQDGKKSRWKVNQDSSGWRSGYSSPPWKKTLSSKETM